MFTANFWRGRRGGEWKMEEETHQYRKTLRVYSFIKGGSKIERKKKRVRLSRVYHRNIIITSSKLLEKRGSSLMFSI